MRGEARLDSRRLLLVLGILGSGLTSMTWAAPPATSRSPQEDTSNASADPRRSASGWRQREVPGDAPGVPARPVPGAPPSAPVVRGPFSSIQVNVDAGGANIPGDAANEPSIAVDPTDARRIAIGWRQFDTVTSSFRQAGRAYTQDGGRTWTFPGVLEPGVFRSDPVLAADRQGAFYYNSLMGDFTTQVFKSTDGGVTWGAPVSAFGGDKQWMAIDQTGGIGDGNVYSSWSVFASCCNGTFTRSTDGAQSFETPLVIPSPPIFGTMAVDATGRLFIGGVNPSNFSEIRVARTSNARNPGVTPSFDFTTSVNLGGVVQVGLGFSSPNPDGLLGQVWVDVDRSSGPNAGDVYVLASVDPPGPDPLDVMFARSADGGQTWSPAVRVNDDASTSKWQWFGTMSVAPDGRIDVVWNDSRNSDSPRLNELFYASSSDGGLTWTPNRAVSPPFDSHLGLPNGSQKLGDYYDMVSDADGAHLAWAATFNGEQDVYYLRLCAQDAPATSLVRNGTGVNPLGFAETSPAIIGATWTTTVDLVTPGASASFVAAVTSGPASVLTPLGELLIDLASGPLLGPVSVATGTHSIPIPDDCSLVGLVIYTQAATFKPGAIQLDNAIDITLGTF